LFAAPQRAPAVSLNPALSVGGGGSRVSAAPQRQPHMFPQRRIGPCIRYRSRSARSASPAAASPPMRSTAAEGSVADVVTTSPASAWTGARRSRQRECARQASSQLRNRRERRARAVCTGIVPTFGDLHCRRHNFRVHPDCRRRHRVHHRGRREVRYHRRRSQHGQRRHCRRRDSPTPTPAIRLLHSKAPARRVDGRRRRCGLHGPSKMREAAPWERRGLSMRCGLHGGLHDGYAALAGLVDQVAGDAAAGEGDDALGQHVASRSSLRRNGAARP